MPLTVETHPTLAEASRALQSSRNAHYLAGGTVLMRAVNEADPGIERLVRTTDPALRGIRQEGGALRLGAHVTMAQIIASREAAFLAPVARMIGGPQVRSAATVAGNLFAPAPYGDFAAALLALGASIEFADGRREALDDLSRLSSRGLVAQIHVPDPRGAFRFRKVTRVRPKGVSLMSIAALLPSSGGRIQGARVVFNGMGERPMRASGAERALEGQALDDGAIARAADAAADGLDPRDDPLASAWYRREVASVHLARLLREAR